MNPRAARRAVPVTLTLVASMLGTVSAIAANASNGRTDGLIGREELIQDVREMSEILEGSHPDPYINGGGKVAYHRRLQKLIRSVPEAGLTREDFLMLLQPFVADVGDGHTTLSMDDAVEDRENPGGLPLYLEVVDNRLFVEAVTDERLLPLIGSTLESLEGVPMAHLLEREFRRQGHDTESHALGALSRRGVLYYREPLQSLVPEWTDPDNIDVVLRHPTGERVRLAVTPSANVKYPLFRKEGRAVVPNRAGWFGYRFLDDRRALAYLWIDNMTTYREMYEFSRSVGSSGWESWARTVFERSNGHPPPDSLDEVIAGIASATETFQGLFREMNDAKTETLIVDVRRNFGGNDLMVQILLYFLVGFDETLAVTGRTATVRKTSPLLDSSTEAGIDFRQVHYVDSVPLRIGDYDFSLDSQFMSRDDLSAAARTGYLRMFRQMPTFFEVFESRQDEACYFPNRILVLSGNGTQSSGFDLLTQLRRLGAEIVGVAPSQAGNGFGDIRHFELANSKLTGWVSTKYFVGYPDEAPTGYSVEPDHPLTYEILKSYDFDPDASLLLALDLIR